MHLLAALVVFSAIYEKYSRQIKYKNSETADWFQKEKKVSDVQIKVGILS